MSTEVLNDPALAAASCVLDMQWGPVRTVLSWRIMGHFSFFQGAEWGLGFLEAPPSGFYPRNVGLCTTVGEFLETLILTSFTFAREW